MPIYEYRCTRCGHEMEVMQKITDGPLRKCKKCSGKLEKLISRTSFQLKGGGWFSSGYGGGNGSSKKTEKKETSTPTDSSKSEKKKTEAKSTATAS